MSAAAEHFKDKRMSAEFVTQCVETITDRNGGTIMGGDRTRTPVI
ncbi:hypothetical protein [uncultured Roseibium sp.]